MISETESPPRPAVQFSASTYSESFVPKVSVERFRELSKRSLKDQLIRALRAGPWIDVDIVLTEFEKQLDLLEAKNEKGNRIRATCLAKLRLALIEAQVQSAPGAYLAMRPEMVVAEAERDTARFFDLFGRPGRNVEDLRQLDVEEYVTITDSLIDEVAKKSLFLPAGGGGEHRRTAVQVTTARLAAPNRMIRRARTKDQSCSFTSNILSPMDECASGAKTPHGVMRDLWPIFQNFGRSNRGD
jgi:hypothetical protein